MHYGLSLNFYAEPMKLKLFNLAISIMLISGCIKDPPENPEADIETFNIPANQQTGAVIIDQSSNKIKLFLTDEAYTSGIAPAITVSAGGKITPASGDSIHFDSPVSYTVTSASGTNQKVYQVEVGNVGDWTFQFEQWSEDPTSHYQFPIEENGFQLWSSGNPGVAFSGVTPDPSSYPTRETNDGFNQTKAAELMTLKGTALSELAGVRLFAGSLFIGYFNPNEAFANPLKATEFGAPYVGEPKTFTGYYKYTPGAQFQDAQGNIVPGQDDKCSIYAIFYTGTERLNATNIQTSDRIVATALLADGSAKPEFTKFSIPFTYIPNRPIEDKMMMAIVMSSSAEGDHYRGAIGSRLVVDSVQIIPK